MARLKPSPEPRLAYGSTGPAAAVWPRAREDLLAHLALIGLLGLGVALLLIQMRGLSFFQDEWDFLLLRRGFSAHTLLSPHNQHLSLVPILIYKAILSVFGARSYTPFKVLAAIDLLLVAVAVWVACRSYWGSAWSLAPVALVVTLGAGGWTWLWPFQVGETASTAAGIAALVAVARDRQRGDTVACLMLVLALGTGSQGLGALAGAALILALEPYRWRRSWVVVLPGLLYGAWYLAYGRQASSTDFHLVSDIPLYVLRSLGATLGGVTGLSQLHRPASGTIDTYFGIPLAIALLAGVAVALLRGWRPGRLTWGPSAALLTLWVAACLNNVHGARPPGAGRYLPVNAAFLLIVLVSALPKPRPGRSVTIVAAVLLGGLCVTNARQYSAPRAVYRQAAITSRAALRGLLLTRGLVDPTFVPGWGAPAYLDWVQAGPYFAAVDSSGSDAVPTTAVLRAPEAVRGLTDRLIARAELVGLPPPTTGAQGLRPSRILSGTARHAGACLILGGGPVTLLGLSGGVKIEASSAASVDVRIRRFAQGAPLVLGTVPAGASAGVRLPADGAPGVPWHLTLSGAGARVCTLAPGYGSHLYIAAVLPSDGAAGVSPHAKVIAQFTAPVDRASLVRAFSLQQLDDHRAVAGSVIFFGPKIALFVPSAPLPAGRRFRATVSAAARDATGHRTTGATSWTFTTRG